MDLSSTYNSCCDQAQWYLFQHCSGIPSRVVKGTVESFAYSFIFSVILSRGNPIAGLTGGAVAVLANLIHAVYCVVHRKLTGNSLSNGEKYCIIGLAGMGALRIASKCGLAVNYKASILFTLMPFASLAWKGSLQLVGLESTAHKPLMATVVSA